MTSVGRGTGDGRDVAQATDAAGGTDRGMVVRIAVRIGIGRGGRRGGNAEQGAAAREVVGAPTVGEQAEVADPHEALRQDVEQGAAEEFGAVEGQ